jgi:hypothetical protein
MLGYQPAQKPVSSTILPVYQLPIAEYRIFGIAAVVISLVFLVMASKNNWSKFAENLLNNGAVYPIWFVIFYGLYIISFLKGFAGVVQISPPEWIVYTVFGFGYALVFYIPFVSFKYFPKKGTKTEKI